MRKKANKKLPDTHQMTTSPPSIAGVLGYIRGEFNEDHVDHDSDSTGFLPDSDCLTSAFQTFMPSIQRRRNSN